ncbi:MAG: hypothetical protein V4682_02905 [Patescibacteria group bacterium]
MDITVFLAQIWGPIMLAIGLGIFVSRSYYLKLYRDLEKEMLAVLIFGMAGTALGIMQISVHNAWNTLPQIIVSVLGWGLLLKGVVFIIAPRFVDRGGDWEAKSGLLPLVATVLLILGAYLVWVGYAS